jgi:hypothetical protein
LTESDALRYSSRVTQPKEANMETIDVEFMRDHLLAWCRKESRSEDGAMALRDSIAAWCDGDGDGWRYAYCNGWPSTRDRMQEYHAYNRDLALRVRTKPFRVNR